MKFIAKKACLVEGRYYYPGDVFNGDKPPNHHFQLESRIEPPPEPETMGEMDISNMPVDQIAARIHRNYGVSLDITMSRDLLVGAALEIMRSKVSKPQSEVINDAIGKSILEMTPDEINNLTKKQIRAQLSRKMPTTATKEELISALIEEKK